MSAPQTLDIDLQTGEPLSEEAYQRTLYICRSLPFYPQIPSLSSSKGHSANSWSNGVKLRLRIVETAVPDETQPSKERLSVALLLDEADTGKFWLAIAYNAPSVVEATYDSSRAFALQARSPMINGRGGHLVMCGMWFEDSADAFEFNISLQEARKTMDWESKSVDGGRQVVKETKKELPQKDLSLQDGQTITAQPAGMGRRRVKPTSSKDDDEGAANLQSFALAPPPPPPSRR